MDEKRSETVNFKVRRSLREAIDAHREERGQTLTIWLERAIEAALLESVDSQRNKKQA